MFLFLGRLVHAGSYHFLFRFSLSYAPYISLFIVAGNGFGNGFFQFSKETPIFRGGIGNGNALCSCSSGAADAVNIVFQISGNVIVEYVGNAFHIQPPGCNIRGHENLGFRLFKFTNHLVPLPLAHVAMDFINHEICFFLQLACNFMGFFPGIAENHCHVGIHFRQMAYQKLELPWFGRFIDPLFHCGSCRFFRNIDKSRMFHIFPCQPHRFFGHGGRKEEKLPLFRRFIHQSFDIFPETIGQHLIRLIQDYRFHLGKVQTFPPDMVQKAAGCTDNDLGIPFQLLQLVFNGPAADDIYAVKTELQSKGAEYVKYLLGKFPGGGHDEDLGGAPVLIHPLDNRKQVGQGLAGACLGATNQILPLKNGRDGSLLDGGGHFNPLQFQKGCQILCYPKCCKCVHISSCD